MLSPLGDQFGSDLRRVDRPTDGPSAPGSWVALAGATTLGAAWLLWIAKPSAPSSIDPSDFMFTAALLLIVAEDEDAVRRMIVAALERQGYSVIAVENGEEAVVAFGSAMCGSTPCSPMSSCRASAGWS